MNNTAKILITGGSGFIGTNLVQYYLDKGFEVLNLDIVEPRDRNQIENYVNCDICDIDRLSEEINKFAPQHILHLAARTDLNGATIDNYPANILGVDNMVQCAKSTEGLHSIIFFSSMLVCKTGYQPKNSFDYCPSTPYGQSKVAGEDIVNSSNLDIKWTIVRPTSIWGRWFGEPYRNFFDMIIKGRYFNFSGQMSTKTYGYIANTLYQIDAILFSDLSNKQCLYLGDYEPIPIKQWAKEIGNELGTKIITLPRFCVVLLAWFGDILKQLKLNFPMTSFRLKNMSTDNIIDLSATRKIAPLTKVSRIEGVRKTIKWLENEN